jgi:hypothetical protein
LAYSPELDKEYGGLPHSHRFERRKADVTTGSRGSRAAARQNRLTGTEPILRTDEKMKNHLYKAWVKTPGGGTYYFAIMAVEFLLTALFFQRSPGLWIPNLLDAASWVTILVTLAGLLALVYWSGRIERKNSRDANHEMIKDEMSGQVSSAHVLLMDYLLPPITLWILSLIVWSSLHQSFVLPNGRVIVLIIGVSFLTLLYPLAQRLYLYRR